jgi:outer membrane usher protein
VVSPAHIVGASIAALLALGGGAVLGRSYDRWRVEERKLVDAEPAGASSLLAQIDVAGREAAIPARAPLARPRSLSQRTPEPRIAVEPPDLIPAPASTREVVPIPEPELPTSRRRPAIFEIAINGVDRGASLVYLESGDLLVPEALLSEAKLETGAGRVATIGKRRFVSIRSLGLRHEIDEAAGITRITASPDQLGETRIDLSRSRAPEGMVHRADSSLFINYAVDVVDATASGFAEVGLQLFGALAHGTVALRESGAVRGPTSLTWDDRDDLRRLVAGDHVVSGGLLGGGGFVGGVHLLRSFELDPYTVTAPGIDLASSVMVPSTAEIYVNGVLVERRQLPPGTFTVESLPATAGAGDAQVVIRDAFGGRHVLQRDFYRPSDLLARGLSDYHVTIGAIRERVGQASFDYGAPAAFGRYRRGIADWLTAGTRAELGLDLASLGATATASSRLGQIELGLAASADGADTGAAGSLAWAYRGRRVTASTFVRGVSSRYANLGVRGADDRALLDGRASLGVPLSQRVSLSAELRGARLRDAGDSSRAMVRGAVNLGSGMSLSTSVARTYRDDQGPGFELFTVLSASLGGRNRGSLSHSETTETSLSRVDVQRTVPERGVGARASVVHGDDRRAAAELEARTDYGEYRVGYQHTDSGHHTQTRVAGGVVAIGGRAFLTPPVRRSFALVRTGVPEAMVLLENRPIGRTDSRGDIILTGLTPYYGNRVSIDAGDVPADYAMPATSAVIAPPDRGGAIVRLEARRLRLVRGTVVVDRAARLVAPSYGELSVEVDGETLTSPLGEAGEFEVDGLTEGRHLATVLWPGGRCRFRLDVPKAGGPVTQLGDAVCRVPRPRQIRGAVATGGLGAGPVAAGTPIAVYRRGKRIAGGRIGSLGRFELGDVPPKWIKIVVGDRCTVKLRVKRRLGNPANLGVLTCPSTAEARR